MYAATKSAADRITKIIATELGPEGIRVNAVAPGLTDTDMLGDRSRIPVDELVRATALGRIGQPEDIAKSVLWLASADSAWVTGQILQASGGALLS